MCRRFCKARAAADCRCAPESEREDGDAGVDQLGKRAVVRRAGTRCAPARHGSQPTVCQGPTWRARKPARAAKAHRGLPARRSGAAAPAARCCRETRCRLPRSAWQRRAFSQTARPVPVAAAGARPAARSGWSWPQHAARRLQRARQRAKRAPCGVAWALRGLLSWRSALCSANTVASRLGLGRARQGRAGSRGGTGWEGARGCAA